MVLEWPSWLIMVVAVCASLTETTIYLTSGKASKPAHHEGEDTAVHVTPCRLTLLA